LVIVGTGEQPPASDLRDRDQEDENARVMVEINKQKDAKWQEERKRQEEQKTTSESAGGGPEPDGVVDDGTSSRKSETEGGMGPRDDGTPTPTSTSNGGNGNNGAATTSTSTIALFGGAGNTLGSGEDAADMILDIVQLYRKELSSAGLHRIYYKNDIKYILLT